MNNKFTKEQLIAKAQEQIEFVRRTRVTGAGREYVDMCGELFEIALKALTAEPEKCEHVNLDCDDGKAMCLSCGKIWEI